MQSKKLERVQDQHFVEQQLTGSDLVEVPAKTRNEFFGLLARTPIKDVIMDRSYFGPGKDVITMGLKCTIEEAVKQMSALRIHSMPVIDEEEKYCLDFVDYNDIVTFLVASATAPLELENVKQIGEGLENTLQDVLIFKAGMHGLRYHLQDADPTATRIPSFHEDSMAIDALDAFCKFHRVAVYNENKVLSGFLSATDLIRYVSAKLRESKMAAKSIVSFGFHGHAKKKGVFHIAVTETILEALKRLAIVNVGALAVIEEAPGSKGGETIKCVGSFSASDVHNLHGRFPDLLMPVGEYLKKYSPNSLSPVCGTLQHSLGWTMQTMVDRKVSHIWLLDESGVDTAQSSKETVLAPPGDHSNIRFPLAVISQIDICNIIRSYQE